MAKEKLIHAEVLLHSETGASLVRDTAGLSAKTIGFYKALPENPEKLAEKLKAAGFQVMSKGRLGISIAGPQRLFTEYFKAKIGIRTVKLTVNPRSKLTTRAYYLEEEAKIPSNISELAESIYIPRRGVYFAGEGPMPTPGYYHLRPPNDIATLTNASQAHAWGYRGTGIRAAMVDSGFIASHDYYNGMGYNITVHAMVGLANQDEVGHGTGIAANLLAVAPDCDFHFYKIDDGWNFDPAAGIRQAILDGVQVISCSWGMWWDAAVEAEILDAVNTHGITVVFACGNGGPIGWPACMSEVVSVGGAYPIAGGGWEASSYASSGTNGQNPGRQCPDMCGITGHGPNGIIIVMPTMMNALFDNSFSGGVFPNGDETAADDGWLVASGTSSAAPQVAGAAALMLEANSGLTPAQIKAHLMASCVDVTTGVSAAGDAAAVGVDDATGTGVLHVGAAVDRVRPCPLAPAVVLCTVAPTVCHVAPIEALCPPAPHIQCSRAPIQCAIAPYRCAAAPLEILCRRAPVIECYVAPVIDSCPPAPIINCLAGPWKEPIDPGDLVRDPDWVRPVEGVRHRLVPVVVLMPEEQVMQVQARSPVSQSQNQALRQASEAARQVYNQTLKKLGVTGEYRNFPDTEGCQSGPFDPKAGI
ncbi:S8 family serine peptidase [bacterium]|nr:S8 family serine peptidase [bacterium]